MKGTGENVNKRECMLMGFKTEKSFSLPVILDGSGASQVAQTVKDLSARPGDTRTRVRSLGWEDLLEEEMATHPRILAW